MQSVESQNTLYVTYSCVCVCVSTSDLDYILRLQLCTYFEQSETATSVSNFATSNVPNLGH